MKTTTLDPKKDVDILDDVKEGAQIILYNDDHNDLDYVIDCLCKYCKFPTEQSTQCAFIVHNKGKYAIKQGDFIKLLPIKEALCDAGLLAEIE